MTYMEAVERFAGPPARHSVFKNTGAFVTEAWDEIDYFDLCRTDEGHAQQFELRRVFRRWRRHLGRRSICDGFRASQRPLRRSIPGLLAGRRGGEAEIAWIGAIRDAMRPSTSGAYVNYIDSGLSDWPEAYYGSNLSRLSAVKADYDPENFFDAPQAIPSAGSL